MRRVHPRHLGVQPVEQMSGLLALRKWAGSAGQQAVVRLTYDENQRIEIRVAGLSPRGVASRDNATCGGVLLPCSLPSWERWPERSEGQRGGSNAPTTGLCATPNPNPKIWLQVSEPRRLRSNTPAATGSMTRMPAIQSHPDRPLSPALGSVPGNGSVPGP